MLPHPDTACVLAEMDRRHALAIAARERRAGEATVEGRLAAPPARMARMRGALLGLVGRRGGAHPAGPEPAAAPALL